MKALGGRSTTCPQKMRPFVLAGLADKPAPSPPGVQVQVWDLHRLGQPIPVRPLGKIGLAVGPLGLAVGPLGLAVAPSSRNAFQGLDLLFLLHDHPQGWRAVHCIWIRGIILSSLLEDETRVLQNRALTTEPQRSEATKRSARTWGQQPLASNPTRRCTRRRLQLVAPPRTPGVPGDSPAAAGATGALGRGTRRGAGATGADQGATSIHPSVSSVSSMFFC